MFETWANDERVTRFLTWQPHKNVEETKELLKSWCEEYEKPNHYNWVIETDGEIIGNISVVRVNEGNEYAVLGYCIGVKYWDRGFTTEATKAVIDYLFGEIGFHRVELCHAVQNPASGRVAQKCGMTFEGTRRQAYKGANGEFFDLSDYAILKEEWTKNKER